MAVQHAFLGRNFEMTKAWTLWTGFASIRSMSSTEYGRPDDHGMTLHC